MFDYDVAAAFRAITAFADFAAFKSAKEFLAFGDIDVLFFPQREGAHRRGGITSAVFAMAVAHLERIAAHLDLYRSAVTLTCMCRRHLLFAMAQTTQDLRDSIASDPSIRHERPILRLVTRDAERKFALIGRANRARSSAEVL
jgi:hypothetical protein